MSDKDKPRVAFFDFACCEGCQLTVLQMEEKLLDVIDKVDIVAFREAMTERSDTYDVAFVEGSITRKSDFSRIQNIRETASVVVALGACAATGGINCLKNGHPSAQALQEVYGPDAHYFDTIPARPINAVIDVDYTIHGCPIDPMEFIKVFHAILEGRPYNIPDHPVCVECRLRENVCLVEKGLPCVGPISRAGCNAICPAYGQVCVGCRGLVSVPNRDSANALLAKHGLSIDDVIGRVDLYSREGYPTREEVAS